MHRDLWCAHLELGQQVRRLHSLGSFEFRLALVVVLHTEKDISIVCKHLQCKASRLYTRSDSRYSPCHLLLREPAEASVKQRRSGMYPLRQCCIWKPLLVASTVAVEQPAFVERLPSEGESCPRPYFDSDSMQQSRLKTRVCFGTADASDD